MRWSQRWGAPGASVAFFEARIKALIGGLGEQLAADRVDDLPLGLGRARERVRARGEGLDVVAKRAISPTQLSLACALSDSLTRHWDGVSCYFNRQHLPDRRVDVAKPEGRHVQQIADKHRRASEPDVRAQPAHDRGVHVHEPPPARVEGLVERGVHDLQIHAHVEPRGDDGVVVELDGILDVEADIELLAQEGDEVAAVLGAGPAEADVVLGPSGTRPLTLNPTL